MDETLQRQIWQARGAPAGDAKIELLERLVDAADALGDIDLAFDLRDDLSEAANAWGRPEKELVAFSWCLAQYDRDPERFEDWDHRLMWTYKRVLGTLVAFPTIPLAQIRGAFADFKARLERSGRSLSTYDEFMVRNALQIGDLSAVEAAYRSFKRHTKTAELDCRACHLHLEVRYRVFTGDDAGAVEAAAALFKRGAPSCNRVPRNTHAIILMPLLRLGRLPQASESHRDYRRIANDEGFLNTVAAHLEYLGYVNDLPNGLKLFEKHLAWAFRTNDLEDRFAFLRASLPLLTRLGTSQPRVRLRLGAEFPGVQESSEYEVSTLEREIRAELGRVAGLFDARNGNDFYARRIGVDENLLSAIHAPATLPEPETDKKTTKKNSLKKKQL